MQASFKGAPLQTMVNEEEEVQPPRTATRAITKGAADSKDVLMQNLDQVIDDLSKDAPKVFKLVSARKSHVIIQQPTRHEETSYDIDPSAPGGAGVGIETSEGPITPSALEPDRSARSGFTKVQSIIKEFNTPIAPGDSKSAISQNPMFLKVEERMQARNAELAQHIEKVD